MGKPSNPKTLLEQVARDAGWQAPDKIERHWCPACRLTPKPERRMKG